MDLTVEHWTESGQAEAFDAIGGPLRRGIPSQRGPDRRPARLAEQLPSGSRVLDLGCGTGLPTARQLTDAGHEVVGVDLSSPEC